MTQHEQLYLLGGGRAAQQQDQPKHLPEDQIQQPQRHEGDRARASERAAHRWSTDVRDILEPHKLVAADRDDGSGTPVSRTALPETGGA